jgi:hypothetical protein
VAGPVALSYVELEDPTREETSRGVGIGLAFLTGAVLAVSAYLLLVNLRTAQLGSTYTATSSNE